MPLDTISEQPSLENLFRQLKENVQNAPAEIAIYCEANPKYEQIAALLKQIETTRRKYRSNSKFGRNFPRYKRDRKRHHQKCTTICI